MQYCIWGRGLSLFSRDFNVPLGILVTWEEIHRNAGCKLGGGGRIMWRMIPVPFSHAKCSCICMKCSTQSVYGAKIKF